MSADSELRTGASLDSTEATKQNLRTIARQLSSPLIAVDLDDVLCRTSECVAEWHNETYGTNMMTSSFYYSYWCKNPGWGTVPETLEKVKEFYDRDHLAHAKPVPGSIEGLQSLHELGYKTIIVTSRVMPKEMESTMHWIQRHFHGIFDYVVFSCQDCQESESIEREGKCIGTSLSKLEVCTTLDTVLLIDDLLETALAIGRDAGKTVLLFGDYEWNKRVNPANEHWDFQEKLQAEGGREWWKEEEVTLRPNDKIWRVSDWPEVVSWIMEARRSNRL